MGRSEKQPSHDFFSRPIKLDDREVALVKQPQNGGIFWKKIAEKDRQEILEKAAIAFTATGYDLSQRNLSQEGLAFLSAAITRYYPNGLNGLKEKLGTSVRDPEWNTFRSINDDEERKNKIRERARQFVEKNGRLTKGTLEKRGESKLASIIKELYPGGFCELRSDLGVRGRKKKGYWKNPQNIENEAREFFEKYGTISITFLNENGRSDLGNAIKTFYPGGLYSLRSVIGEEANRKQRGYWTPENIKKEAQQYAAEHGGILGNSLAQNGRGDLLGAIHLKYPGGMSGLKRDLGLKTRFKHNWTHESVEAEAARIYDEHGSMDSKLLVRLGMGSLKKAINKYPGGIRALRDKLGIGNTIWPIEKIEEEARKFFDSIGCLTAGALAGQNRLDLSSAINKFYPGGIRALRDKLGAPHPFPKREDIPITQAQDDLWKLLEVANE